MPNPPANKLSKPELLAKLEAETFSRTLISFYRYVLIDSPKEFRDELYLSWSELGVLGRIYVSQEGINAQISIPSHKLDAFRTDVDSHPELKDVPFKIGLRHDGIPFWKLIVKARKYILADGLNPGEYDVTNVGTHLSAKDFNDAIDGGATVVDMRNNYESQIGHFDGAICPDVETFREELPVVLDELKGKEDEKILLYCTGGIRCEKTSAYLKHHGFSDVNQLHGGIIDYKHQIDAQGIESKFRGANFVFDEREPEVVTDDLLGTCFHCRTPANSPVNCTNQMCHMLFVQCCDCQARLNRTCSEDCKKISLLPEDEKKRLRKGFKAAGRMVLK